MKTLLIIFGLLVSGFSVYSQQGYIRGKVTDGETGEALFGATVLKQGTDKGISTDFDGNYSLALDAGIHTIVVSYISYQTQTFENVQIKAGEVTALDIILKSDVAQLGEVVVTAEAMKDSETGIMTFQKRSANLLDGISNQTFRKTGDRDLASAIRRVTGVSVQSGKFVYVRGLGDRYTRTTLNNMTIPGLDPDRNDVQIDIFPTAILENVVVYKTFSPNLPGDFTGGIVDVELKNFPEEKTTAVSLSFGYNPKMNLKSDYLSYEGGKTDWLGFDDGTRELPFPSETAIPDESKNDPKLESLTRSLDPTLGVERKRSFLNTTFTFNHGNQINKGNHTFGYSAIFNYQSRYEYYNDSEFGEYTKNDDRNVNEFFKEEVRRGALSRTNVLWSGLLAGSVKFKKHSFFISAFRTQNGLSETSDRVNTNYDQTLATLYENILTYSQRSVTNGMLGGTHQFGKLRMEWKNSLTFARTYDPDFRATSISITNPENYNLNSGEGAGIKRFWRDLNEYNENLKVDFTLAYGKANKLQFGASGLYKDRKFEVSNYLLELTTPYGLPSLDANYFLRPENIWTAAEQEGTFLRGNYEAANNYEANSSVYAGYLMTEMAFGKLRAIYGARLEKADMHYTGEDIFRKKFDNEHTLDELNILPSVNLVFALNSTMNLRASFGQTVARPSFREKSTAQIYDPIMGRFFNGNIDLEQTEISNYDLRWEKFANGGDMISLSAFYKQFDGHIELVTYDLAADNVKPRNAGDSRVYGAEFEFRKRFDFISPALSAFSFGTNITVAASEVDLKSVYVNDLAVPTTEYVSRQENARAGETVDETRAMGGQSPYLINAYLNYADEEGIMNANLAYNVQGKSLSIIGNGAVPDIYTQPFHSLNFNVYRNFGIEKKHRVTLRIDNILDAERKDTYEGHGDAEAIYTILRPGTSFTLGYGFTF